MKDSLKEMMAQTETADAGKALQEWLRYRTREALLEIVEEEVSNLCGPRHFPVEGTEFYRAGSAPSSLYLGSVRQEMNRPRVRRKKGKQAKKSY